MAQQFDMKQATAVVPMYDGSAENLDAFIDAVQLLGEITPAAHTEIALKFIKTRLTKKARLGLPTGLNTIQDIINDVKQRCKGQEKPESIIAKFKQLTYLKGTENFLEEVENLTLKLKSLYMEQQVPEPVANTMATRVGLDSLINGIQSNETKLILKAGNFNTIKDAIQKVNENASQQPSTQMLWGNTKRNSFNYNRYNNRYPKTSRDDRFKNFNHTNNARVNNSANYQNSRAGNTNFQNRNPVNARNFDTRHPNNRQTRNFNNNRRRIYTGNSIPTSNEENANETNYNENDTWRHTPVNNEHMGTPTREHNNFLV